MGPAPFSWRQFTPGDLSISMPSSGFTTILSPRFLIDSQTIAPPGARRLKMLKAENGRPKRMLADAMLDTVTQKNLRGERGGRRRPAAKR